MTLKLWFKAAILLLILACHGYIDAQTPQLPMTEAEARARLEEKGITEDELRARLAQKGWNEARIESLDAARLPEFQRVVLETVDELEREKKVAEKAKPKVETPPPPVPQKPEVKPAREDTTAEMEPESDVIFGHHLFAQRDLKIFRQADEIQPTDSYILGPGDQLLVQIYGPAQVQSTFTIDELGYVQIKGDGSNLPRIALKGLTLREARALLKERLRRFFTYSDDQFSVTVQQPRTITVNFFGEVKNTGGITLPAVNTIFNALVAAGGPTGIGSVRNIKLISGDKEKVFDLYRFMTDPRSAEEFYLQQNDYVHIPVAGRVVRIRGAVNRPYKYELAEGENLVKLIEFAGGARFDAYLKDIQIERYANDQRFVASVDLRELMNSGGDYILYHGDEITVGGLSTDLRDYVEVDGAVVKPGKFEFIDGMRVADLLDRSTLLPDARRDFGYILRLQQNGTYQYVRFTPDEALTDRGSGENILLMSGDVVKIRSSTSYADETYIAVDGSVRDTGRYAFEPGSIMRVQDAILISGGLTPSASEFGYIVRRSPSDPMHPEYLPFNAQLVNANAGSPDNILLQPMDSIYIFDRTKMEDAFFVRVSGAVRNPGLFPYGEGITIQKILRLAGGFRFSAATNRVDISRVIVQENEPTRIETFTVNVDRETFAANPPVTLLPLDHVIVREVPEFELERTVYVLGEIKFPGVYSIIKDNERISSFIERAGGLTEEAFPDGARLVRTEDSIGVVVINLEEGLNNRGSISDIILRHQDTLFIPKRQELVTISGAVNFREVLNEEFIESGNRINVGYVPNKRAIYYINKYAAGVSENGRKRLISVRHANGRLEKTESFGFFHSYPKVSPGATINVGSIEPKTAAPESEKKPVDWGIVIRDTIAQATAVLTLILLLERVN